MKNINKIKLICSALALILGGAALTNQVLAKSVREEAVVNQNTIIKDIVKETEKGTTINTPFSEVGVKLDGNKVAVLATAFTVLDPANEFYIANFEWNGDENEFPAYSVDKKLAGKYVVNIVDETVKFVPDAGFVGETLPIQISVGDVANDVTIEIFFNVKVSETTTQSDTGNTTPTNNPTENTTNPTVENNTTTPTVENNTPTTTNNTTSNPVETPTENTATQPSSTVKESDKPTDVANNVTPTVEANPNKESLVVKTVKPNVETNALPSGLMTLFISGFGLIVLKKS